MRSFRLTEEDITWYFAATVRKQNKTPGNISCDPNADQIIDCDSIQAAQEARLGRIQE